MNTRLTTHVIVCAAAVAMLQSGAAARTPSDGRAPAREGCSSAALSLEERYETVRVGGLALAADTVLGGPPECVSSASTDSPNVRVTLEKKGTNASVHIWAVHEGFAYVTVSDANGVEIGVIRVSVYRAIRERTKAANSMASARRTSYVASAALAAVLIATPLHSSSAKSSPPRLPCSGVAGDALAGVADGLSSTWGAGEHPENRLVLKSALASMARLRVCGDEQASISAEMIAADAYEDVYPNKPELRCAALRDARKRLHALGDARRIRLVSAALTKCH